MFCILALFFVGTHGTENYFRFKITKTQFLAKMYFGIVEQNGFSLSNNVLYSVFIFLCLLLSE